MRLLLLVPLFLVGCGGFVPSAARLTWRSDGNPRVPACAAELVNCKQGYELLDQTSQVSTVLPLSASSFAGTAGHSYGLRVFGYDGGGVKIYSAYIWAR